MSSENSKSTEPAAGRSKPGLTGNPAALVAVTLGLLAVLVAAIRPSDPHLVPAPLHPMPAGCPKGPAEFTPTNLTEIRDPSLEAMGQKEKNRALLRLNMEPCPCGCGLSLASCRVSTPSCETSQAEAGRIVDEERGQGK